MGSGDADLQWLKIDDFSPGIQQRVNFQGSTLAPGKLGAATINTWRCIALAGGGLGPLPKRTASYAVNSPASTTNLQSGRFTISGFHVAGPVFVGGGGGQDGVEAHFAYEYNYTNLSAGRRYRWERHRIWESSPTIDTLKTITATDTTGAAATLFRPTFFHNIRADNSDATQPGSPLVAATWFAGGGGFEEFWSTFPDPASPGTTGVKDISTNKAYDIALGHQGRSLTVQQLSWPHGTVGVWAFNEQIWYTNSNLVTVQNSVAQVFGQENATGYTAIASMSASELLMLKLVGGAYLVRGDIANPTVTHLPGVVSPGNARHTPVNTPIGLIYLSHKGGAWLWNGGEMSTHLSPQLEGDFYETTNDFLDYRGKLAQWKEWTLFPNNFLYDFRTNSFWRIDNPSDVVIFHWDTTAIQDYAWGAPAFMTDNTTPIMYTYTYHTPASNYQWESQPIPETMYNQARIREVVLVAQGTGTVAITVTADDGTTSSGNARTLTFTLGGYNRPQLIRQACDVVGTHVQVKAVADNGSSAAPIIYEIRLGNHETHHVKVSN